MVRRSLWLLVCLLGLGLSDLACGGSEQEGDRTGAMPSGKPPWEVPDDFEPVPIPPDNRMTLAKVDLGRRLYFDKRLSGDGKLACYSCHVCDHGLTDGRRTAIGAFGKNIGRSAPSMWNVGYHDSLYWDGRAPSLERQAMAAWKGGNMGARPDSIVEVLNQDAEYHAAFHEVFGAEVAPELVTKALGAYMRTILCFDTPFDRYQRGVAGAMSAAAVRGWEVFRGKAGCGTCHAGFLLTDLRYHNVGIGSRKSSPDIGRFKVTKATRDTGAFKTPGLRDVSRSAPYFHDGSVATLEEAVEIMAGGGVANPHLDPQLEDRKLTGQEKKDLVAFLEALDCPCDQNALSLAPR
ncbi:MAG: cytochrome-c peroxidase [Candidatus Krumholzibacteriia bacterium]